MLGMGLYGEIITNYLLDYGITVDDYFIDTPSDQAVNDYEDIKKKYSKFIVIIGFFKPEINYLKIEELKCKKMVKCYFFGYPYPYGRYSFITADVIESNKNQLEKVFYYLTDLYSKKVFEQFLKAKISVDDSNLLDVYSPIEYFPKEFCFNDKEIIVDGGAYIGDTLESYLQYVGTKFEKWYAFEPDEENYKILKQKIYKNLKILKAGLGEKRGKVLFRNKNGLGSAIDKNGQIEVDIVTIDKAAPDATFIKLDIEGAELEALKGAEKTIKKNKPKLAVCIYHKFEDIFEIPLYIKSIVPEYKIFFKIHEQRIARSLVCYASV